MAKGRCYYCEHEGAEIIHPDLEKYLGRDIDFETKACSGKVSNGTVCDNEYIIDFVDLC